MKTQGYTLHQELETLDEEKKSFSDGIHQVLDALATLKRLAGESIIARDLEITAYILRDALLKTNSHIDDLRKAIAGATFEVQCAVCGPVAQMCSFENAVNYGEEHRMKRNNLHVCVVIEK